MIKTFDTFKPASEEFPVAFAEDIDFEDGESLQEKLDNGTLGGGSSEEQIKDWVSGNSYLEGDYIYHEGELYRCLASNNDVDFDETNWEQLTYGIDELSKEDVERLLGLTKEEIEAMADLILDTEARIDKTYSSSKIYTDIQQCLEDSKAYTLEEIARASTASYKVVASTSEMTSESIIYLLANGNTYDMYIVEENGATTKIGNMDVNLDNYFTKAEIEDDYLKKTDADGKFATITTLDNHISDTDNHINDTDIHITADERTKWNNTADKVNGEDLVKKADIKTTLDESSTNEDVCGGKAIYDTIKKNCIGKETVLFEDKITATGTYTLNDNVNNYDFIVIHHKRSTDNNYIQSIVLSKNEINKCINSNNNFMCVYGNGDADYYTSGYFNNDEITITACFNEIITSIVGYKFGQITVQNTITNPAPDESYSTDEQLTGGTWIDGKPIYRKTINISQITQGYTHDLSPLNIDKFIDVSGFGNNPSRSDIVTINYSTSDYVFNYYITPDKAMCFNATGTITDCYITIEYTKTTD